LKILGTSTETEISLMLAKHNYFKELMSTSMTTNSGNEVKAKPCLSGTFVDKEI
jgi:hypothetical protein